MLMDLFIFSVLLHIHTPIFISSCIFIIGEENAGARRVKDGEIVMFHLNVKQILRFIMQRK